MLLDGKQTLALQPEWSELHYRLAVVLHQFGDWPGAARGYRQAIALQPDRVEAYLNLGMLCDRAGELQLAVEYYCQAIAGKPEDVRTYNNLGCVLVKQKAFEAAVGVYQQALTLEPTSAALHNNLGQVFLMQDKPEEALVALNRALELDPTFALAHYNLGRLWEKSRDFTTATLCFEQAIALNPEHIAAYGHCAAALIARGQLANAMQYFRQAIARQPAFVETYCQQVERLREQDILEKAKLSCIRLLESLQKTSEDDAVLRALGQTYRALGDVFVEYGDSKQAEVYYHKALQIQPKESELYWRLGNCLAGQQRFDAAIAMYRVGLTLQPDCPRISFELGNVLAQQQRFEQAIAYYEKVLQSQCEHQGKAWEPSPLVPFAPQPLEHLQGIYRCARDWIAATAIAGYRYWEANGDRQDSSQTGETPLPPSASVPSCKGVNCLTCIAQLCQGFKPISLAPNVYRCSGQNTVPIALPTPFVLTLPQGQVWVEPQTSFWKPCRAIAIVTPDRYLLGDVSRDYPGSLPGCIEENPARHRLLRSQKLPPLEPIKGTVAVLCGLSGHIYYHWMLDILPRIGLLRRSGIALEQIDWFFVNSPEQPFQQETLKLLGIPAQKILSSDRHPHIQAQQLAIPSFPGPPHWATRDSIAFLRQAFLSETPRRASGSPQRLYISRARARYRQIIDEAEVTELLSQFGFVSVFLEELTVVEQIALFRSAEAIVAPHGSNLTNLVFCNRGTKIIELFSANYVRPDYWIVSQQLGLQHYYVKGHSFECFPLRQLMYQSPLTEDILVDLRSLRFALEVAGLTR
jgi:tetratricopeptide (TPR) repeat protein/capsular polysaccharide biosynthesis protein